MEVRGPSGIFFLILNAYTEPLEFQIPKPGTETGWRRLVDTSLESPDDIQPWTKARAVTGSTYVANPHSVVVLSALITPIPIPGETA